MSENIDYSDVNMDLRDIIEGDGNRSYAEKEEASFGSFGFQTQEIKDGEFVDVETEEDYAEDFDDEDFDDDSDIDE